MAKYDPLNRYLRRQTAAEVVLTFSEIENLLAGLLPKSARRREWWANETSPASTHVQRLAWMQAGYHAFPSVDRERVTFRKDTAGSGPRQGGGRRGGRRGEPAPGRLRRRAGSPSPARSRARGLGRTGPPCSTGAMKTTSALIAAIALFAAAR